MSFERNLKRVLEQNGKEATLTAFNDALTEKKITPDKISFRRLAEAFMGDNWADNLMRYKAGVVRESAEAVDGSLFTAITGQILINEIKDKYQLQANVAESLATTIPVVNGNLSTQKVPYLSDVTFDPQGDNAVQQLMPYPQTGFLPQFIEYPAIKKVGKICAVSMEMLYSDLTTQALDSARSVGSYVALIKLYDILKVMLGITNNYKFNGTTYNTYQTSGPWINKVTGFSLTDWSSINILLQLAYQMRDPVTSQPIEVTPTTLFVMPQKVMQAKVILNATATSKGAFAPAADAIRLEAANPLDNYNLLTSQYAFKTLVDSGVSASDANNYIFFGDPKKAFVVRSAKPLTVVEAPPLNPLEFNQDVAVAIKASEMYSCGIRDPRFMFLGTN